MASGVINAHIDDGDDDEIEGIRFVDYKDESQLDSVMSLVGRDLSEPYSSELLKDLTVSFHANAVYSIFFSRPFLCSVFTYRYFLHRFPQLCILAVPTDSNEPIGCVVGKVDEEVAGDDDNTNDEQMTTLSSPSLSGYIGMLAVSQQYRRRGIGKALVQRILRRMRAMGCASASLETEVSNVTAQRLYQDIFGFIREELLVRYYLNWNDAYRLRLWFSS
jgi:peptide alpha-N-acetyltransferase